MVLQNERTVLKTMVETKGLSGLGASLGARATPMDTGSGGECRQMFSKTTKAIVWGMQTRAVQSMMDFDFICR